MHKTKIEISSNTVLSLCKPAPVCDSCGYERKQTDKLPNWACPACGVSYGLEKLAIDETGQFYANRVKLKPRPVTNQSNCHTVSHAARMQLQSHRKAKNHKLSTSMTSFISLIAVSAALLISIININKTSVSSHSSNPKPTLELKSKPEHLLQQEDRLV